MYERIVKELWDEAQRQLECCGVETFADWSVALLSIFQNCCLVSFGPSIARKEKICQKSTIISLAEKAVLTSRTNEVLFIKQRIIKKVSIFSFLKD